MGMLFLWKQVVLEILFLYLIQSVIFSIKRVCLLEAEGVFTQHMEKAKTLNGFLALVFTHEFSSHILQLTEGKGYDREIEELPAVGDH